MGEKDNIYASSRIAHTVAANDMILVAGEGPAVIIYELPNGAVL